MNTILLVSGCAFLSSFLGCFQVLNLTRNHKFRAALTSCAIAFCQLQVYKNAPHVDTAFALTAYVFAGLLGSQLSMLVRAK